MPHARWSLEATKGVGPVLMAVGMLARKPANHVAMIEIKTEEGTRKEAGPMAIDVQGLLGWWPS